MEKMPDLARSNIGFEGTDLPKKHNQTEGLHQAAGVVRKSDLLKGDLPEAVWNFTAMGG